MPVYVKQEVKNTIRIIIYNALGFKSKNSIYNITMELDPLKFKKFHLQSLLAIDYGEKNIGLATFKVGKDPFPLKYGLIKNNSKQFFYKELSRVIAEEEIDILILGLPHLLDGGETPATKKMKNIGEELQKHFAHLSFFFQDETLSSEEAKSRMKNSAEYNYKVDQSKIDIESALIILEDFMRSPEI